MTNRQSRGQRQHEQYIGDIDVTPVPAMLPVFRYVDVDAWACVAELLDNSLDDFQEHSITGGEVHVTISNTTLEISDNGHGMDLQQLQNSLRAGYSSRNRADSLGLFGVGFNVATARLGNTATVTTKQADNDKWYRVTIDINKLKQQNDFTLGVASISDPSAKHGTTVAIDLYPDQQNRFRRPNFLREISRNLGKIYSYILRSSVPGLSGEAVGNARDVKIFLGGNLVEPWIPCIWDENRTVMYYGQEVKAIQKINQPLPNSALCNDCGHWHDNDSVPLCLLCGSSSLQIQARRVWGWVGVQRHMDELDFGVDFLRNGRRIIDHDKEIFTFYDPTTGAYFQDYPVEWPSNMGRFVGEIHLDHVQPDFMKQGFLQDDRFWAGALAIIRGDSSLRPQRNRNLPPNNSPLATIFNAFRRNDPGVQYLIPGDGNRAIHVATKNWAEKFHDGDPAYKTDQKWYEQARTHDRIKAGGQDPSQPTDTDGPGGIVQPDGPGGVVQPDGPGGVVQPDGPGGVVQPGGPTSSRPESPSERMRRWRAGGAQRFDLSLTVTLASAGIPFKLEVWETPTSIVIERNNLPVFAEPVSGNEIHVFAATAHPVFKDFGRNAIDLILMETATMIKQMRVLAVPVSVIYSELLALFPDQRRSEQDMRARITEFETRLKGLMAPVIAETPDQFWASLSGASQEQSEVNAVAASISVSWTDAMSSGVFASYLTLTGLRELIEQHPERFFDQVIFKYNLGTSLAPQARQRTLGYVLNAMLTISQISNINANLSKYELGLVDHALNHLNDSLV